MAIQRVWIRPAWAAQGRGQDVANLFVVYPPMLIALRFVSRGSARAMGLLVFGLAVMGIVRQALW